MEKQKRWQRFLIIAVILLTIYNILPTIFYYTQPLNTPITQVQAEKIGHQALQRVNSLESFSIDWVQQFSRLLSIKGASTSLDKDNPQFIHVRFKKAEDASLFKTYLPRAGALIPFTPAQLSLAQNFDNPDDKTITLVRNIPLHFNPLEEKKYFHFANKSTTSNETTPEYQHIINDRLAQLMLVIGGPSEDAQIIDMILNTQDPAKKEDLLAALAEHLRSYTQVFGENSPLAKRMLAYLTQGHFQNRKDSIEEVIVQLDAFKDKVRLERIQIHEKEKSLKESEHFLDTAEQQRLEFLEKKETLLTSAAVLLKNHLSLCSTGHNPWSYTSVSEKLTKTSLIEKPYDLTFGQQHPLIANLVVDLTHQDLKLTLHPDVIKLQTSLAANKEKSYLKDQLEQLIFNEIARISRETREIIQPFSPNQFSIHLSALEDSNSLLIFNLNETALIEANQLYQLLTTRWHPAHEDLQRDTFPIWDYATYKNLPANEKKLGLVIYAPSILNETPIQGFRGSSVYVIAKGLDQIVKKFEASSQSPQAKTFIEDFKELQLLLKNKGYYGYPGSTYPLNSSFAKDFIFESENFASMILNATREDFKIIGTGKYAVLEFSNLKQRIHTLNQIEDKIHEDLLKWRDEYHAAQVNPNLNSRYDIPKPISNPLWSNFVLSIKKYFRGDDRKILKWGLDLSGGKTVQIELRDQNNRKVINPEEITQGINELYQRVNKMGVSEVSIRQDGSNITLDFPGAQNLSAGELVKASSMYFHIVNETFTPNNPNLASAVNKFLQDVWNEAIVTNKKDIESINRIAWKHLYGDSLDSTQPQPRSESAKILYEHGLRLALPEEQAVSSNFNETYSKIALIRGNNFSEWFNQTNPLLIVFNNYALEGSNLTNVHSSYDPTKGNFLAFEIKSSQASREGQKFSPRADLYLWTSTFAKEKIAGTPAESVSRGKGWRMAVILNGSIISAPTLDSALKDSAMITGSFSQREVNKLETDLKAGSLTFSPVILSEQNISPELGTKERFQGILATVIALVLVIGAVVGYYRFAGLVASIALMFNLLIMWAIFQNIQAAMTLAGIAGVILTMGMAVDANVLVFERIKEEFKATGRLASAIQAGYKRAFSAIIDSNITTIIAALILLHFDSGPIKGFAVTIIIGIISSMFTSLFMTRYFFAGWIQNPQNKTLTMSSWIRSTKFQFLKFGNLAMMVSVIITMLAGACAIITRHSILGLDFTGGFALSLEINPANNSEQSYRSAVERALKTQGLSAQEFQIRELGAPNFIRIFLSKSLEQPGKPFYGLPLETTHDVSYGYENNPRIMWVVNALDQAHLTLTQSSLQHLDNQWTNISGQFSDAMRTNALYGLLIAFICILFYITLRFEFKYAVAATFGLIHDVIITVGTICILHACHVPIQIELNTIAALMAIIGYSLNDTIIIFDRIREDLKVFRKLSFKDLVNQSLNITLSRTLMTSGTTVLVLLALVCLGGPTLFGFSLVMMIGIVYGTLSSLFIATPLLYYLQSKEEAREHNTIEIKKSH